MDHDHLLEDLDLDLDLGANPGRHDGSAGSDIAGISGLLAPVDKAALEEHVSSCAECQRERENLLAVHRCLAASVVRPREGFTGEVMRALSPAPWEARAVVVWRWPFALLLALGGIAAVLLGGAAAKLDPSPGSFDAFVALARLLESAALAGAGLLGASWRGLGSGLAEWLGASRAHLAAAAGILVGLNLLCFRLLRAGSRKAAARKSR
jgi:hypothetical protein